MTAYILAGVGVAALALCIVAVGRRGEEERDHWARRGMKCRCLHGDVGQVSAGLQRAAAREWPGGCP